MTNSIQSRCQPTSAAETTVAIAILVALLDLPAALVLFFSQSPNPDVWWHLSTGHWIVEYGTIPTSDPFSFTAAETPWVAYSWLFELVLVGFVQFFGLAGITLFTAAAWTLSNMTLFFMIRRYCSNLLVSGSLTLIAVVGMAPLGSARPWHFTILFFLIELALLLSVHRPDQQRRLLWLVPLFVCWANLHIQFVIGLVLLALALLESSIAWSFASRRSLNTSRAISPVWLCAICVCCTGATLLTPYGLDIYRTVWTYLQQAELRLLIQEFRPMRFLLPSDWVTLSVALAAAFAIGRIPRIRLLLPMLLVVAVYLSFRTGRDGWLVLVVGTTALAHACRYAQLKRFELPWRNWCWVFGILAITMTVEFYLVQARPFRLKLAKTYPVQAVEWIRKEHPSGPMYNTFDWGGFLIHELPEYPVSIDGRTNVHGAQRVLRHANTVLGRSNWKEDTELLAAGFVLLQRDMPLARLLACDGQFELAYEDELAVIFIARSPPDSD